jgi:hypothetical protein
MGAQSDFMKQLCTIKSVPELIKYKFESVVDIQRRGLTLNGALAVEQKPVFASQEQEQEQKQKPREREKEKEKEKEKDKFLDIGLASMDWKKMHDWFHAVLRLENPIVELMTHDQYIGFRNEWFSKEIEFLGTAGAKGTPFQRARNDIRAAFNNYQIQTACDSNYGGLKTHDENKLDSNETMILLRFVCWHKNIQCLWLEDDRTVRPFPQDARMWSKEKATFFWDRKRRAMGMLPGQGVEWLGTWLSSWELDGKEFNFPPADGKKSELIEEVRKLASYKEVHEKMKKDELAVILGRAEVIGLFTSWMT